MTPHQFESYQAADFIKPKIHAGECGSRWRTLVYGYNLDGGGTVHGYLWKGELCRVIYDHNEKLIDYIHGTEFDPILFRPSKRAYPERTDRAFADLLRSKGEALTFTRYNEETYARTKGDEFHGKTHLDFLHQSWYLEPGGTLCCPQHINGCPFQVGAPL